MARRNRSRYDEDDYDEDRTVIHVAGGNAGGGFSAGLGQGCGILVVLVGVVLAMVLGCAGCVGLSIIGGGVAIEQDAERLRQQQQKKQNPLPPGR